MSFNRVQYYKSQRTANRPCLQGNNQSSTLQKYPLDFTYTQNHAYYKYGIHDTLMVKAWPNQLKQTFDNPLFDSSEFLRVTPKKQCLKIDTQRLVHSKKRSLKVLGKKSLSEQKIMQVKRMSVEQQAYSIIKKSIKKDLKDFVLTAQQIQNKIDHNAEKLNIKQMIKIHDFRKKIKQQMEALQQFITNIIEQEQTKNTIVDSEQCKRD